MTKSIKLDIEYYQDEDNKEIYIAFIMNVDNILINFNPNVTKQEIIDFIQGKKLILLISEKDNSKILIKKSNNNDNTEIIINSSIFEIMIEIYQKNCIKFLEKLMLYL